MGRRKRQGIVRPVPLPGSRRLAGRFQVSPATPGRRRRWRLIGSHLQKHQVFALHYPFHVDGPLVLHKHAQGIAQPGRCCGCQGPGPHLDDRGVGAFRHAGSPAFGLTADIGMQQDRQGRRRWSQPMRQGIGHRARGQGRCEHLPDSWLDFAGTYRHPRFIDSCTQSARDVLAGERRSHGPKRVLRKPPGQLPGKPRRERRRHQIGSRAVQLDECCLVDPLGQRERGSNRAKKLVCDHESCRRGQPRSGKPSQRAGLAAQPRIGALQIRAEAHRTNSSADWPVCSPQGAQRPPSRMWRLVERSED